MKYSFEGLFKNEFTGIKIACNSLNQIVDGTQCIDDNGMNDSLTMLVCVFCLLGLFFGLLILSYLALFGVVLSKGKGVEPKKIKDV